MFSSCVKRRDTSIGYIVGGKLWMAKEKEGGGQVRGKTGT